MEGDWTDMSGRDLNILASGTGPDPGASYPSIFNDVIGPVMRGPSSSHCAAAVRIGRMARDLMGGELDHVLVEFHPTGSLATTHKSQGSDMGLCGGLLGWDATDDRLVDSARAMESAGIQVEIRIADFPAPHPNTYRLTLRNRETEHRMTALSTGGGMIRVVDVDGLPLSMGGDYFETLFFLEPEAGGFEGKGVLAAAEEGLQADEILLHSGEGISILQVKTRRPLPEEFLSELRGRLAATEIRTIAPVLPVQSRLDMEVPFINTEELLAYNEARALDLWELAVHYESARGGISHQEVVKRMGEIVRIMEGSIEEGLQGTEFADRILGPQSGSFLESMESGALLEGGVLNRMILYVTAIMETKSAMGVIVAAPTAGSCGALPGATIGAGYVLGVSHEDLTRAMLAAGIVGVFIAARSTFAAEVCGCQAECGAGSGMAAAALATLAGGTTAQALGATSMALQNTLGLICDPVANRVEVPCLGRNVLAASNALACANMALAGFDPVIPLDEVIRTMDDVGKSLPHQLRCTALGGLSVTKTSKEIEGRLRGFR
jgi:L-serine dehydratase